MVRIYEEVTYTPTLWEEVYPHCTLDGCSLHASTWVGKYRGVNWLLAAYGVGEVRGISVGVGIQDDLCTLWEQDLQLNTPKVRKKA